MNIKMYKALAFVFILMLFLTVGGFALAQSKIKSIDNISKDILEQIPEDVLKEIQNNISNNTLSPEDEAFLLGEDISSATEKDSACFDFYPYGQLNISMQLDKGFYIPGETAILDLNVLNTNARTSLTNAKIIFQIRKAIDEKGVTVVLSEEVIAENIVYPSLEETENNISFKMPNTLPSGLYYGYIYITDNDYVISGLPFTQDVVGKVVGFRVENESKPIFDIPYFKETEAMINDELSANPFQPIHIIDNSYIPATITVPVYNPGETSVSVDILSELYSWDESGGLLGTKRESIKLESQEESIFSFVTPNDLNSGTYMLRTTVSSGDSQSISKIRISVPGFAPKIYYAGISTGDDGKDELVSCVGNSTYLASPLPVDEMNRLVKEGKSYEVPATDGRVVVELSDNDKIDFKGKLFSIGDTNIYESNITSELSGNTSLSTVIYDKDGNIVEKKEILYKSQKEEKREDKDDKLIIYILIGLVAVIIIVFFVTSKTNDDETNKQISRTVSMLLLILFISIVSFSGHNNNSNAASSVEDRYFMYYRAGWNSLGFHHRFYMDQSIDFVTPSSISAGSTFDIDLINNGSWYYTMSYNVTPPFSFTGTHIESPSNNIYECYTVGGTWGGTGACLSHDVSMSFPYTDTWTTNNPAVSCNNINATTARCTVGPGVSGNVDVSVERSINMKASDVSRTNFKVTTHGWQKWRLYIWRGLQDIEMKLNNITTSQTKTINVQPSITILPSPINPLGSCSADGAVATISWDPVSNADNYALRAYDTSESWLCTNSHGRVCTVISNTSITFPTTPGSTYSWWVHAGNTAGWSGAVGGSFTCPIPVPPSQAPTTSISCDPTSCEGYAGAPRGSEGSLDIIYSAADPDNDIQSCSFKIDGSAKDTSCSNTYLVTNQELGAHTASITAADAAGLADTSSISFTIKSDIAPDFDCSLDNANFESCSDVEPTINQTVYFRDKSSASTGAAISNWSWSFDNGLPGSSTQQNSSAKFTVPGDNNVTFTITDNRGRTGSITKVITVEARLQPQWKEWIPR